MFINSCLVKHYFMHFIKLGLTPDELEARSGISLEALNQNDAQISLEQFDRLSEAALKAMKSPATYLRISEKVRPEDFGIFGTIARHCKTLGDVCRLDSKYSPLISSGKKVYFLEDPDYLYFLCDPLVPTRLEIIEPSVLIEQLQFLRKLTHDQVNPRFALFRHPEPAYSDEYRRIFRCPVLFNQNRTALIYDREVKHHVIQPDGDHVLDVFTRYAETLLEKRGFKSNFKSRVASLIEKNLPHGTANIQAVADTLAMSRQTVYLKLKQEGTSFSELLQEVRKHQMLRYVSRRDQSFQEISELLGYSDVSVFYRTFKKWFNLTPRMYRQNRKEDVQHAPGWSVP